MENKMRREKAEQEWQAKNHQRKISISEMAKEQFEVTEIVNIWLLTISKITKLDQ